MSAASKDSFSAKTSLEVSGKSYQIFDITKLPGQESLPLLPKQAR